MRTVNIQAGGVASLLVSAGDGSQTIINSDAVNTLWLGDTSSAAASDLPNVVPLGPGGSMVVNGENDVYAIADPATGKGTIQTLVVNGGLAYFLGLTQGFGKLVVTSLQSPNYIPGFQGWIIRKDGTAEFHSISLPSGSGGATVTFSATAPVSPNIGDVWYDITNGLLAHQWNGSAWAPFLIGPGGIAVGSLTASVINVADLIANGINTQTLTAVKLLQYSGTNVPTVNLLEYSSGNSQYKDSVGNWVLAGEVTYGPDTVTGSGFIAIQMLNGIITWYTAGNMTGVVSPWAVQMSMQFSAALGMSIVAGNTVPIIIDGNPLTIEGINSVQCTPGLNLLQQSSTPAASGGNAVLFCNNVGELIVIDGLDQVTYATERRSLVFNGSQTSTTTFTTAGSLSSAVSANRTYRFRGQVCWVADQSAGQVAFRFNGPASTAPTQASFDTGSLTSHWTPAPVGLAVTSNPALTMVGGQAYTTKIDGVITTTAAGTFSIQIANVNAGSTFHLIPGTYLDLMPV